MEIIIGNRMQREEGRQKVRKDIGIAQGRNTQGKHRNRQKERQEACIAGYVRRELIT